VRVAALRRLVLDACDGPFGSGLKSEHYTLDGARVIRLGNIGVGRWIDTSHAYISEAYWAELRSHQAVSGDVVVAGLGDSSRPAGRACIVPSTVDRAIVKADCYRLRPDPRLVDAGYLVAALSSQTSLDQCASVADGSTRPRLTLQKALAVQIPLPPLDQQRAIATFLRTELDRLDGTISRRRDTTVLLSERERVACNALLLEVKSNGSSERPLWSLVREIDERLGDRSAPVMLSVSIHSGVVPRSSVTEDLPRADDFATYKTCLPGDIVLNRMRAFQGGVGVAHERGIVSPDYTVLRPGPRVTPEFLHHVVRSHWFVSEMSARLRGIGSVDQGNVRTPRINWADLRSIVIPVPSIAEQTDFSNRLTETVWRVARSRSAVDAQLALLNERRRALITAALNGQLDITTGAA
jgi:type I restriction enzyme, S subunit